MNTPISVFFIHGWAANHHVFDSLISQLPEHIECHSLDLPGHGAADTQALAPFDVIAIADAIASDLPNGSHLLGWSLGGLIAMYIAARHPEKVKSLVLTATFAKFIASDDYPQGLKNPALAKMVTLFESDYPKYMQQFFQLQFMYRKDKSHVLTTLMPLLTQYGCPPALSSALDAIYHSDARDMLPNINQPTCLIFGNKDTISTVAMGQYLQEHIPTSELVVIDKAAHAPFLSHEHEFIQTITDFWNHNT